jgi:hypothetical protein
MPKLLAIAETLLLDRVLSQGWPVSNKSKAGFALILLSALLGAVATGLLIVALHAWLGTQFTPDLAALITAGVVFALSIIAALTAAGIMHKRTLHMQSMKNDLKGNLQTILASFDDELGDHVRENPAMALALATVAGFILADRVL